MHCELNSCPERLCEGTGQTLRKEESCASTLAFYMNYLSIELNNRFWLVCLGGTDKDMSKMPTLEPGVPLSVLVPKADWEHC